MSNSAVILLSGGLDSLVALGYSISSEKYDVKLALTFDYGQKSSKQEILASKNISDYYGIKHRVIKLDWLAEITQTALVSDKKIPSTNFSTNESAKSVWVPNRNALFLNIAASFCDAENYKYIIFGANKDEGRFFSDNTEEFRASVTKVFESSTLVKPKVVAPLINCTKDDIVKIGADNSMPLDLVWSCYHSGERHCGKCESCNYLKNALIANHCGEIVSRLF